MARLPRLMGTRRALEVLLGADDTLGFSPNGMGTSIAHCRFDLDTFVESLATESHHSTSRRSARPSAVDVASLRLTLKSHRNGCVPRVDRSAGSAAEDREVNELGFHRPGDVENRLADTTSANSGSRHVTTARIQMSHHASGPNFGSHAGTPDWT